MSQTLPHSTVVPLHTFQNAHVLIFATSYHVDIWHLPSLHFKLPIIRKMLYHLTFLICPLTSCCCYFRMHTLACEKYYISLPENLQQNALKQVPSMIRHVLSHSSRNCKSEVTGLMGSCSIKTWRKYFPWHFLISDVLLATCGLPRCVST